MIMKINVYDFDKTIYDGDSTVDFHWYCIKKNKKVLWALPGTVFALVLYVLGIYSKTTFKEKFYHFLKYVKDIDKTVLEFWRAYDKKIKPWYLEKSLGSDVIISASPDFLLSPICNQLGIKLIASIVDNKTGKYTGVNCYGDEKLKRLGDELPGYTINEFYSDSLSDRPLSLIAQKSYIVLKNTLIEWDDYSPSLLQKMKVTFLSIEFLLFVFCGGMGTLSNFIFSLIISIKLNPTISYAFGYALSLFVAYSLNSLLIFKEHVNFAKFAKFVASYIPNFLILFIFVCVFLNYFGCNKVVVYAFAGLLGLPVTFILVKFFAFSNKE
jgi:Phosphoserine phosphatase